MAKSKGTTTTTFEKVGDNIAAHVLNVSGGRSNPYTMTVKKNTQGRGASPTGKSSIRGSSMIHEANGPKCHIVATLYKANAAEAGLQTRNVRILRAVMGDQAFQPGAYGKTGY